MLWVQKITANFYEHRSDVGLNLIQILPLIFRISLLVEDNRQAFVTNILGFRQREGAPTTTLGIARTVWIPLAETLPLRVLNETRQTVGFGRQVPA